MVGKNAFTLSTVIPASPERVYTAWLSSREHAAFTGSPARISPEPGGEFSAWDGYISGKNLELEPYTRIVQSWRTTEFPEQAPDSRLELLLEAVKTGTKITLKHSRIPAGQAADYQQGWEDFYFSPLRTYFKELSY